MPTKNPTPEQRAEWEAGRRRKRSSVSLDPRTTEALERLTDEWRRIPLSAAIDLAVTGYDSHERGEAHAVSIAVAASLLNVSPRWVEGLIESGDLHAVDDQIRVDELREYKRRRDAATSESLRELVRLTEEVGGYEDD